MGIGKKKKKKNENERKRKKEKKKRETFRIVINVISRLLYKDITTKHGGQFTTERKQSRMKFNRRMFHFCMIVDPVVNE